jgi:D-alanyl-D-alanine carboxypeptidase (penicillin-binding protein 5/6)
MKKSFVILLILLCLIIGTPTIAVEYFPAKAGILVEAETGRIIFAQNEHQRLPPASVTKVMTMLLLMEAVDSGKAKLSEKVTTSPNAAGMGGSQIYLREGEVMTLEKMIEAIAVVSANDASTAVAEHLFGTTEEFVALMNRRAQDMGLKNTNFINETGLPHPEHYTSVYDMALIARQLVVYHQDILRFTSIETDTVRDGAFVLHNTNKLISTFQGADGLKTGHTQEAGFCLAATAKRSGMRLISIVFGAKSDSERLQLTRSLLELGFRNYQKKAVASQGEDVGTIKIMGAYGKFPVKLRRELVAVVKREEANKIQVSLVPNRIKLPVAKGEVIGKAVARVGEEEVGEAPVITDRPIRRANILIRVWMGIVNWIYGLFGRE